jgi:hypothetical protein
LSYVTLFISIQGVGGAFNAIFILIANSVPTERAGSSMTIIMSIGVTVSLGVPIIVLLDQPYPYLILCALMSLSLLLSFSNTIKEPSFLEEENL